MGTRGRGKLLDEPERIELDHGNLALAPHRHVGEPAVPGERHLVGVVADGNLPDDPAQTGVDHLKVPGLVAGDVHPGAVRRDRQPVGLRVDLDPADLPKGVGIHLDQLIGIAEGNPERDVGGLRRGRPVAKKEARQQRAAAASSLLRMEDRQPPQCATGRRSCQDQVCGSPNQ